MGFGLLEIVSGLVYLLLLALLFLIFLFVLSDVAAAEKEGRWMKGPAGKAWQYGITGMVLSIFPCWLTQGYSTLKFMIGDGPGHEFSFTFTAILVFWAVPFLVSAFWVRNVRYSIKNRPSRSLAYFFAVAVWFAWAFDPVNDAFLRFYSV